MKLILIETISKMTMIFCVLFHCLALLNFNLKLLQISFTTIIVFEGMYTNNFIFELQWKTNLFLISTIILLILLLVVVLLL